MQTYTADTITLNMHGGSFEISDPDSLWTGQNQHDLYKQAHTPWESGLIQSLSQPSLPGLSAWVEVGGIAPVLCLKAPLPQPISI